MYDTFNVPLKRRVYPESDAQAAIVAWVRTVAPGCVVAAIPNGEHRDKRTASKLRWQGVLAGMPDLVIVAPGGITVWAEIKAAKGRLSEAQSEIGNRLRANGCNVVVWKSIDCARITLAALGIATREALP